MAAVTITYLSGPDVARLNMSDGEILDAVAGALQAQGTGGAVIEPRVHLVPDPAFNGHFNVLRGYVAPLNLAGVKIVGDYLENFKQGLPSEMARGRDHGSLGARSLVRGLCGRSRFCRGRDRAAGCRREARLPRQSA